MKLRLQERYALIITAFVVAAVVVLATVLVYQSQKAFEHTTVTTRDTLSAALHEQLETRGLETTGLLARNLTNPVYQLEFNRIYELLANVLERDDVLYTYVFDEQGTILHDGREDIPGFGVPMTGALGEKAAGATEPLVQRTDDVMEVTVPLRIQDRFIGGVRVGFSLAGVNHTLSALQHDIDTIATESKQRQYHAIVITTFALMLAGVLLAVVVARGMTRPLTQLAASAARIGAGLGDTDVSIRRDDEIGDLAAAFRTMRANLRHTTVSKTFLDRLVGSMNEALVVTDVAGNIRFLNPAASELFGYPDDELQGRPIAILFQNDGACVAPPNESQLAELSRETRECWAITRNGKAIPVAATMAAMHSDDTLTGAVYVIQDISERRRDQHHLELAASVYENTADAIMITDFQGAIVQVNPAFIAMTGCDSASVEMMNVRQLAAEADDYRATELMLAALAESGNWQGELQFRRDDGSPFPVLLTASTIRSQTDAAASEHFAMVFSDLSERREAEQRIHHLAYYDNITGLPNRLLFRDRLDQNIRQAHGNSTLTALLYLDLDRFKVINDTRGHAIGDGLLKQVAARLAGVVREQDTIARLGGDEFGVILPDIHREEEIAAVAQQLVQSFAKPFDVDGEPLFTATSMGISVYPTDAMEAETLLKNADAAMYRAKEQGRNTYQFYTSDLNARVMEHLEVEHGLHEAIENEELELYYQPQFDLRTGELVGVEALLRWNHPQKGLVPPFKFIPVAEESGLILEIGTWVIREACAQLRQWTESGMPTLRMALNLSARQFSDPHLLSHIQSALDNNAVDPSLLEMEITESLLMDDLDRSVTTLMRLNQMGIRIAIDDFGTGYSSLNYLKRFPIQLLKIDKGFIRDIHIDQDDASITSAIITMGHNLGIKVLAEGVETEDQQHFLRERGCDFAQGYYYSRPVPADECREFILDYAAAEAELKRRSTSG